MTDIPGRPTLTLIRHGRLADGTYEHVGVQISDGPAFVVHFNTEGTPIKVYRERTLEQAAGTQSAAPFSLQQPMGTAIQAVKEYEREMEQEGIPQIVHDALSRAALADDARRRVMPAPTTAPAAEPDAEEYTDMEIDLGAEPAGKVGEKDKLTASDNSGWYLCFDHGGCEQCEYWDGTSLWGWRGEGGKETDGTFTRFRGPLTASPCPRCEELAAENKEALDMMQDYHGEWHHERKRADWFQFAMEYASKMVSSREHVQKYLVDALKSPPTDEEHAERAENLEAARAELDRLRGELARVGQLLDDTTEHVRSLLVALGTERDTSTHDWPLLDERWIAWAENLTSSRCDELQRSLDALKFGPSPKAAATLPPHPDTAPLTQDVIEKQRLVAAIHELTAERDRLRGELEQKIQAHEAAKNLALEAARERNDLRRQLLAAERELAELRGRVVEQSQTKETNNGN